MQRSPNEYIRRWPFHTPKAKIVNDTTLPNESKRRIRRERRRSKQERPEKIS
jgi:hypothetical protein